LKVSEPERSVTGNRKEFIGRNGSLASPAAMRRTRLSGRAGAGFDPCAAMQTRIELADGQEREIVFVFGAARNTDEAQHFIQQYGGPAGARQALDAVLGLRLEVDQLRIAPCIPSDWESYKKIHYRYRETVYHITVRRVGEGSNQVMRIAVDGAVVNVTGGEQPQDRIPLVDDRREHYVEVDLG